MFGNSSSSPLHSPQASASHQAGVFGSPEDTDRVSQPPAAPDPQLSPEDADPRRASSTNRQILSRLTSEYFLMLNCSSSKARRVR
jgi:hypothetical protein